MSVGILTVTHQEAVCDAASVHFGSTIRRTDILVMLDSGRILPATFDWSFNILVHIFCTRAGHVEGNHCSAMSDC